MDWEGALASGDGDYLLATFPEREFECSGLGPELDQLHAICGDAPEGTLMRGRLTAVRWSDAGGYQDEDGFRTQVEHIATEPQNGESDEFGEGTMAFHSISPVDYEDCSPCYALGYSYIKTGTGEAEPRRESVVIIARDQAGEWLGHQLSWGVVHPSGNLALIEGGSDGFYEWSHWR